MLAWKPVSLFFIVTYIAVAGCGTPPAEWNRRQQDRVTKRASFDLQCPGDKLTWTPLSTSGNGSVEQWGVAGCDHRIVYVAVWHSGDDPDWVADTQSSSKPPEASEASKTAPASP